jgi:two-component system, cell cycle response regulator DivK
MPARILIIEDNPANMELMQFLLEAHGQVVVSAADGESGVELARRERLDLILCDVQLPRLDGFGVVRTLKADKTWQRVPVIAVTAFAMVGDRDRVLSAGFDGYLAKPIEPEAFVGETDAYLPLELRAVRASARR